MIKKRRGFLFIIIYFCVKEEKIQFWDWEYDDLGFLSPILKEIRKVLQAKEIVNHFRDQNEDFNEKWYASIDISTYVYIGIYLIRKDKKSLISYWLSRHVS